MHIEQMQVAPGIWLPRITTARSVEATDFRRVGTPTELLPLVRRELGNGHIQVPAP